MSNSNEGNKTVGKQSTLKPIPPPRHTNTATLDAVLVILFVCLVLILLLTGGAVFYNYYPHYFSTYTDQDNAMTLPQAKYWDPNLPRTSDAKVRLNVDLEHIYLGQAVEVTVNKRVICSSCSGTGAKSPEHLHICSTCGGKGHQNVLQSMGFIQFQSQQTCPKCGGKGKSITETCPKCSGSGTHMEQQTITLPIEKGIPEEFLLRLPYGADEHPSYAPGDMYFYVHSVSKKVAIRRDNNNLHCDITITLLQALVGFKRVIPHLVGEVIIERDEITIPGQILVFPNKGMPFYKDNNKYGDLFVHVTVEFPYIITDFEKEGFKKLLGSLETAEEIHE